MDNNPIRNTDVKGDKAGDKTTLEINGTTFDAIELSGDESRSLPANSWVELDGQPTTKVIYDSKNSKPLYIKKGGVFYKIVEPSKQKEQATTTESTSKPIEIKTHNKPAAKNTTDSKTKTKAENNENVDGEKQEEKKSDKEKFVDKVKEVHGTMGTIAESGKIVLERLEKAKKVGKVIVEEANKVLEPLGEYAEVVSVVISAGKVIYDPSAKNKAELSYELTAKIISTAFPAAAPVLLVVDFVIGDDIKKLVENLLTEHFYSLPLKIEIGDDRFKSTQDATDPLNVIK